MTTLTGNLRKMQVTLLGEEQSNQQKNNVNVEYSIVLDDQLLPINDYIEQPINLIYNQKIHCIHCGRKTNKSFNQGYCYPCFKSLARCDHCIISPEKCHYEQGTCRETDWADEFCMQDHFVYLANTSSLKVGITRGTQIPIRWIDQGAVQALPIYRVKTRHQAGLVEALYKEHIADKTNWRAMLKGQPEYMDLVSESNRLHELCEEGINQLQDRFGLQSIQRLNEKAETQILFPVNQYPTKIASFNLDKEPEVNGILKGIKGQYLLLDSGVINLRKYGGYNITLNV